MAAEGLALEGFVSLFGSGAVGAILIWLIKREFAGQSKRLEAIEAKAEANRREQAEQWAKYDDRQRSCQLSLVQVYRTKQEAQDDSKRQWEKIDDQGKRITRLETLAEDGK